MIGASHTLNIVVKDKMLIGNSGCHLHLLNTEQGLVVRKISGGLGYNSRLESQCRKQKEFSSASLLTPEVLNTGYIDGLFFLDMEYIRGMQLSEYVRKIRIDDCLTFLSPFTSLIPDKIVHSSDAEITFKGKLDSLKGSLPQNKIVGRALSLLYEVDWKLVPNSSCHGDLTLENILVQDGKLYLIDFLDSFYDSWIIDLAKLFQDIKLRWAYRREGAVDENTNVRLLIMEQLFTQEIQKHPDGSLIIEMLQNLLILNLLRIIPYIRNETDREFVYSALERML